MSTSARRRLLRDFKRCVCPLFFRAGSGAERECSCGRSVVGRASGLPKRAAFRPLVRRPSPRRPSPPLPFPPVPVPPRPLLVRLLVLAGHLDSICHGCAPPPPPPPPPPLPFPSLPFTSPPRAHKNFPSSPLPHPITSPSRAGSKTTRPAASRAPPWTTTS